MHNCEFLVWYDRCKLIPHALSRLLDIGLDGGPLDLVPRLYSLAYGRFLLSLPLRPSKLSDSLAICIERNPYNNMRAVRRKGKGQNEEAGLR